MMETDVAVGEFALFLPAVWLSGPSDTSTPTGSFNRWRALITPTMSPVASLLPSMLKMKQGNGPLPNTTTYLKGISFEDIFYIHTLHYS